MVCDEPTSALDVSVQAAILNLLAELQRDERTAYLFISHDLGVVRYLSDRIAVLYLGRLMELGPAERVFSGPHHPYTEALLSAVPTIEGGERPRIKLRGRDPQRRRTRPSGCVFHTRCPRKLGEICETTEPPLAEAEPGHMMRCHIPIDDLQADAVRGGGRGVITRAAVLERVGAPLEVTELELAPPGPGEVLVRLHASGVCHSDQNAIDGTAETPCPAVLGHEGGGVVSAVGPGVTRVPEGAHVALSWAPACGHCAECLDDLPHLCGTAWPMMAQGTLMDGTSRLSRGGDVVHHYSFLSTFAEHAVVPEASCVVIPDDVPLEIAGLVGCAVTTGICAVWRSAEVRPGQRAAVIGCGGVGLSAVIGLAAVGAAPIVAVDVDDAKLEAALSLGATDAVRVGRLAGGDGRGCAGGRPAAASTSPSRPPGRSEAMLTAFLATRRRGTAVFIGIPRADAVVPLPALSIPRMERRVIGALYGSARPDRDFLVILDQYRRGRLPLDRLVSHRLPLDEIERAFDLLRSGSSLRAVLDLTEAA